MIHRKAKSFTFECVDFSSDKENNLPTPTKKFTPAVPLMLKFKNLSQSIPQNMKNFLQCSYVPNALKNHRIASVQRIKMIEWMIEVTIAFSTKQTFFSSVKLMDKFFYMADKVLEAENLHIIGLTAMFISSKVCDVKPVRLKDLVSKIGMFKYSKNEIIEYEQILLKTVDFNVNLVTVLDFLLIFSQKFKTSMIFLYNCEVVCYYSQMNYKMLGFYEDEIALGVMFYVATRLNKEKIARDVICEGNNDKIYAISIETANWISDVNNFINSQRLSKFLKSEIINEPKAIFKFSDCKLEFEHQKWLFNN